MSTRRHIDPVANAEKLAAELEKRWQYRVQDLSLLATALTHRSLSGKNKPSNERLEFVGDRVLALVIASYLWQHRPDAAEGMMALHHSRLASGNTCATVARQMQLGSYVATSPESLSEKDSVLADALEAVIGAIFLDGTWSTTERIIQCWWQTMLDKTTDHQPDPKSALQAFSLACGWKLPSYTLIQQHGPDHQPRFTVSVSVGPGNNDDPILTAIGEGGSKQEAEKHAAQQLYQRLNQQEKQEKTEPSPLAKPSP